MGHIAIGCLPDVQCPTLLNAIDRCGIGHTQSQDRVLARYRTPCRHHAAQHDNCAYSHKETPSRLEQKTEPRNQAGISPAIKVGYHYHTARVRAV